MGPNASIDAEPRVERGAVHLLFAFDVGASIDLERARTRIARPIESVRLRLRHRAPQYFQFEQPPLRAEHAIQPLALGRQRTSPSVEESLYDFGGVTLRYTIPFEGPISDLVELTCRLSDDPVLADDARERVRVLTERLGQAITRPEVADALEDYLVIHLETLVPPLTVGDLLSRHGPLLARILRAEGGTLSDGQMEDALQLRLSYSPDDLVVVDWVGALVFDREPEDVLDVLELANLQLLEMRRLDDELDRALDGAYDLLAQPRALISKLLPAAAGEPLRRVGRMQVDGALLFERVNNSLKLLGDPYLARLYRQAGQRFSLPDWNAGVLRKLETLESIYTKISDHASALRMELLEWIIILLILFEVVMSLLPG